MTFPDYELERRLEDMDKRFGHVLAYVKRLESRVDELERGAGNMRMSEEQYQEFLNRPGVRDASRRAYRDTMKPPKKRQQPEHKEQVELFRMAKQAEVKYHELELLNGSLNGVRLNIGQAMKAKAAGMKRGYPDVFLPVPRKKWHGLYIEMKAEKSPVRPEQKTWLKNLAEQGYYCTVCYTSVEAFDELVAYLDCRR